LCALKEQGIYEAALREAFVGHRVNHSGWPEAAIAFLFDRADKNKLRLAGDPVPNGPVVVHRGVAGHGPRRRLRGYSWTALLDVACWFALRLALANPTILTATVETNEVFFYTNGRNEQEFVVSPRSFARLVIDRAEIEERSARHRKAERIS